MAIIKTYPALASVNMPRGAVILDAHPRPSPRHAPSLVVSVDPTEQATETRHFATLESGYAIPDGARFIASWRAPPEVGFVGPLVCLFELDLPFDAAAVELSSAARTAFHSLVSAGFKVRASDRAWIAPVDVEPGHLSAEQMVAVATLQEYGYGPVVE